MGEGGDLIEIGPEQLALHCIPDYLGNVTTSSPFGHRRLAGQCRSPKPVVVASQLDRTPFLGALLNKDFGVDPTCSPASL